MNPPPPPRTPSAAIQHNADKLLDIVRSESTKAIAFFTPRLVEIERSLIQLQNAVPAATAYELTRLQAIFTEFRNSSGILAANTARIQELEAALAQLHADNQGLHASVSAAIRDATIAREKEEQAKIILTDFLTQLSLVGIGQRGDGTLGFGPDWKVILEEFGKQAPQAPGQVSITHGLSSLAAKLRNQRAASEKNSSVDTTSDIIDLVADSPTNEPSQQN
ncbi:hypothetical protein APHAL10511_001062 [Amanita phalloides]|nr:hypothetical protein APHAL10511_001062 [Amanita phalloides]